MTTSTLASAAALLVCACFSPTYPPDLVCSPSGACPPDQVCDLARRVCISATLPQTPTLTAANDALSWTASPGATGYLLERATAPGGPYQTLATLAATSYLDTDFDDGVSTFYVVRALNDSGSSARSNEVTAARFHQLCITGLTFVATFLSSQDGDGAPLRSITGANSQLTHPYGIAADLRHDEIIVANYMSDLITVFPRAADGDVAPLRVIAGSATGLSTPYDVAVDPVHDEIFVANYGAAAIDVYARTASGDVAPLRTIRGPSTGLSTPYALALDLGNDELVVADFTRGVYLVFPRTASGDATPRRTVTAPGALTGIAVDEANDEIVATQYTTAVRVYDRLADGAMARPLRSLTVPGYTAVVDPVHGELIVTRSGGASIFARTASGSDAPRRVIEGGSTGFGNAGFAVVCL